MPDDLQKIIQELAILKNQVGQMLRVGSVHEVKAADGEQKIRVVIGTTPDGKPMLSPWLHTSNQRGEAREEARYVKGQNVLLMAPNGDMRQAVATPWAESKERKRPDHAADDAETYQFDKLRVTKKKDAYEIWLADEQKEGDDKSKATAASKVRIHNDGGITARIGKDMRFAVSKDGVKMRAKNDFAIVKDGKLIVSRGWEIGEDDLKNDDD